MSYKELIETLIKRMKEVGYDPSSTFVKMLLKEYEDLLMENNTSNILLRSIIARLRGLPDHDRCIWLKAIIDEFDKELSHAKWKEGYEQGKFEGACVGEQLKDADKIRQESNKPVVPQFVADWLSKLKSGLFGLNYDSVPSEIYDWVYATEDNLRKLHLAFVYGYEVEKDKKYIIKFKGISSDECYLNCINNNDDTKDWILYDLVEYPNIITKHTRKELEDAKFEWVFECPGVEVDEVKE